MNLEYIVTDIDNNKTIAHILKDKLNISSRLLNKLKMNEKILVNSTPVFSNFILADEINRGPAKVQSAFLEAMQERQVTIGEVTYPLPDPFLVLATQNPIEQEGTYPLAEAQVDRFMLKLKLDYPTEQEERAILERYSTRKKIEVNPVITLQDLEEAKKAVDEIYVDDKVKNYIVDIVIVAVILDQKL